MRWILLLLLSACTGLAPGDHLDNMAYSTGQAGVSWVRDANTSCLSAQATPGEANAACR